MGALAAGHGPGGQCQSAASSQSKPDTDVGGVPGLGHVLRLLGGLGVLRSLRGVGGLRLVAGLDLAFGGEAVHAGGESLHGGVHGVLVVLGEAVVRHHGLSLGQSGAEHSHRLGGVALQVEVLSLVDDVLQDGLVRLEPLCQDGVQQGLGHRLDVLL